MFEQTRQAVAGFAQVFGELPLGKKIALAVTGVLMLAGILVTSYFASRDDYSLLYASLTQEDMLSVTEKLKERNIPYRIERGGSVIFVPVKDVYQLRLELAGEGLPSGGGVGFEIFDQSTFGMTEFVQKLNLRRALQGELQRTINSIGAVISSRVHIVLAQKTLFEDDQAKSTASVVLKLKRDHKLTQGQVEGISHLVAAAVESLSSSNVTIVDNSGNILSKAPEEDAVSRLTVSQMEYRRNYEQGMEKRLRSMLERAIGLGKVIVRVNADIDFRQVQRTEETFDPDSQVARSEQRNEEKTTGAAMPVGVAGVGGNLPGSAPSSSAAGKPAESSKVNETINYELNKVVQTIIEPSYKIKKLSVAVMVDGRYTVTRDDQGNSKREFQPLGDEEKSRLANLVRTAIGFEANRQDLVAVEGMQFAIDPLLEEPEKLESEASREYVLTLIRYAGVVTLGVVIFLFFLRPVLKWMGSSAREIEDLPEFPKNLEEFEQELAGETKPVSKKPYRTRVSELVGENPDQAAELVRMWLKSRG
ncbi:MAG: flagellar basal-body MS-ring/collar protein FliF [Nitrospinota bacterium]